MFEQMNNSSNSDSNYSPVNLLIFNWIVFAILVQIFVVFGVISNTINIVCFVKQGFQDSINVSLTGLAISDLGCLIPLMWTGISYTPAFYQLDLSFEVSEIQYMTSGITHVMLTRVSSWITATITVERCLCVAMPLKLKEIVTPRKVFIVITSIFAVLIAGASPQYYYYRAGRKYVPRRNTTLIGIIYSKDLLDFERISYFINLGCVQVLAFVIIIVCTAILSIELNVKAKWRKISATSENTARLTSANIKIAKVVVMIAALFIASYIPIIVNCIAISVVPGFTINGKLEYLLTIIAGLGVLLESVNASTNIVIYYYMSSKYREVFLEIPVLRMFTSRTGKACAQRKITSTER